MIVRNKFNAIEFNQIKKEYQKNKSRYLLFIGARLASIKNFMQSEINQHRRLPRRLSMKENQFHFEF